MVVEDLLAMYQLSLTLDSITCELQHQGISTTIALWQCLESTRNNLGSGFVCV